MSHFERGGNGNNTSCNADGIELAPCPDFDIKSGSCNKESGVCPVKYGAACPIGERGTIYIKPAGNLTRVPHVPSKINR
jgi:hypothetical protein